jgi:hypothetical protein
MATPEPGARKATAKERLQALLQEYGSLAIGLFAFLWVGTLASIYLAVRMGWRPESAAGQAGTFGMAYLVFRLTLPVRIAATLVLTPLLAKLLQKFGWKKPTPKA